jgi:acetyl-CoA carboxylase biotin carboxyl carrier protein
MARLDVDTKLIETLAELLQRTGLTEIELAEGEARIRVARQPAPVVAPVGGAPVALAEPATAPSTRSAEPAPATRLEEPEADHPGAIRAPMVGTAYLTPEPGAPPFVTAGSEVREGQTLLIIEAMKVMNPIRAPRAGRVREISIQSGDPVEYGELLLVLE